ncbi:MAG: BatD family protein [Bdellovibrionia bacterium]
MARIGSFLIAMFLQSVALAGVTVTATVDRNEVSYGDSINLQVAVSADESLVIGDQRLPDIDGFALINQSSGRESRSVFSGGKFQFLQTQNFNYMLQTTKKGTLTIPPVEVVANNKAYKTQAITIKVLDQGSNPQPQQRQAQRGRGQPQQQQQQQQPQDPDDEEADPFFRDADDLFNQMLQRHGLNQGTKGQPANPEDAFSIQLEVDKNDAFVGEQVTASWYLYTRNHIQNIDTLKYPNLKAFWKEDIELATRLNFQQEVVNGIPYKKALLVSYALFPIRDGSALIDTYKAKCTVISGGIGVFGMGQPMAFTKASPEVSVKVKPLPTAGRPADFSGGVGEFEVRSTISARSVPAHQPFSYKIKFEGRGNAKTIELPQLQLPVNLELYDTKAETKFFKEGNSYKEFELLIIPRQEGKVSIPEITVSIFDPKKIQYITKSVPPIEVTVTPGRGVPAQTSTTTNLAENQPVKPAGPQLILEWDDSKPFAGPVQAAVWSAVFLLVFGTLGWKGMREFGIGEKRRSLKERAGKRFKIVRKHLESGNWRGVGAETTNIIYFTLAELAGEKGANTEIGKLWEKLPPSIKQEFGEKLKLMLKDFEMLSFAPEAHIGSLKEPKELKKLIDAIEELMYRAIALGTADEEEGAPARA